MKPEETRSSGEYYFHYDRQEREAGLSEYAKRNLHARGFFRKNRSLVITMIDVAVLVLLFLSVTFYLRTRPSDDSQNPVTLETNAYSFEGRIYVTLTFERVLDESPYGAVRVFLRALPDDVRMELNSALPEVVGESRTIRGVLVSDSLEPILFATIDDATGSRVVRIDVQCEPGKEE